MLVLVGAVALPAPAFAHGGPTVPVATSFAARITAVPGGLHAAVVDGDQQLWLQAPPQATVIVLGLAGEPFLRFTPRGVDLNERSPTAYLNRPQPEQPPPSAGALRAPLWRQVSAGHSYRWHEDRLHALAATVRSDRGGYVGPWTIALKIDGRAATIRGGLWSVPPPSLLWFWPLGVALLCAVVLLRARRPALDAGMTTALTILGLATIVAAHAERDLHGRPGLAAGQLAWLIVACAFAVAGAVLVRRPRWRALVALATTAYALDTGLTSLDVLRKGHVLGALPPAFERVTATGALTAGLGGLLVLLLADRSTSRPRLFDRPETTL